MTCRQTEITRLFKIILLCIPPLLLLMLGMTFAKTQCVWVDEAAQLSGLTLSPWGQVRWLAGFDENTFGVPHDRNPPLSYWVQSLWISAFGNDEYTLRMCSLAAMTIALLGVMTGSYQIGGFRGCLLSGLLFAVSPNITTLSVEIRPYAFLIALSALTVNVFISILLADTQSRWQWTALIMLCLAATYCHFYGVVSSTAFFLSAMVLRMSQRRSIRPQVAAFGVYLILSLGIAPFVLFSVVKSQPDPSAVAGSVSSLALDIVKNVYRLVGHPAAGVYVPVCSSLLAGTFGLFLLAMMRNVCWRNVRGRNDPAALAWTGLAVAILLGAVAPCAAAMLVQKFKALSPHYSAWIQPVLYVAFAGAWARSENCRAVWSASLCAVIGALGSCCVLMNHQALFVHGAYRQVNEAVSQFQSGDLIVVHDLGQSPFALLYEHGKSLVQTYPDQASKETGESLITIPTSAAALSVVIDKLSLGTTIIAVSWEQRGAAEIRRQILAGDAELGIGPVSRRLLASADWQRIDAQNAYGYEAARIMVFQNTAFASKRGSLPHSKTDGDQTVLFSTGCPNTEQLSQ